MNSKKLDLRQRQSQQTRAAIREAAFDLFEARSVATVTVEEIVQAAGVSPRTFYRHFAVKERVASLGVDMLAEALESYRPAATSLPGVLDEVLEIFISVASNPDTHGPGGPLRFRKLIMENPELRTVTAGREAEISRDLSEHLVASLPEFQASSLLLVAETAVSLWRAAWLVWTQALTEDPDSALTPGAALDWCRSTVPTLFNVREK